MTDAEADDYPPEEYHLNDVSVTVDAEGVHYEETADGMLWAFPDRDGMTLMLGVPERATAGLQMDVGDARRLRYELKSGTPAEIAAGTRGSLYVELGWTYAERSKYDDLCEEALLTYDGEGTLSIQYHDSEGSVVAAATLDADDKQHLIAALDDRADRSESMGSVEHDTTPTPSPRSSFTSRAISFGLAGAVTLAVGAFVYGHVRDAMAKITVNGEAVTPIPSTQAMLVVIAAVLVLSFAASEYLGGESA